MQSFKIFLWVGIIGDVYFVHISNADYLLIEQLKMFDCLFQI